MSNTEETNKLAADLQEALSVLDMLVDRRYRASFGSLRSTDGRYEHALKVLIKHNTPFAQKFVNNHNAV